MEDVEILNLWKSYNKRLQESLVLSRKNTEEITKLKAQSFLTSMRPRKQFTLWVGIIWVGLIDLLIVKLFFIASPFFIISMGIQVLLTKVAIVVYLYQLMLLRQTDVSEPILATQERIARLRSSTLWVTRLLFLQLPAWTTFFLSAKMFMISNVWLILLPVVITAIFTYAAIWLFLNIKYENRHKKWFRLIFSGKEWDPMMRSMELLDQISEYKKEA
ncbi:hypothetical protein D3H65_05475 [Paraflavitalea soli]|uniref:Uncharacterized protein n=1 Tax=Paraflavitalea soli TaxID=2315862 RepID=A0A3B7MGY5_9BACT|nr:hypothetical protein [Paraflavitalea soli]AXY73458.1 hypothetical protein D3H65_05475 [Paraflavitalea soli]